jgi:DNA-directed RNA polymerase III subunit RPC2
LLLTAEHIRGLATGECTLEALLAGGVIEYVDVNEENNCLVALDEDDITPGEFLSRITTEYKE